MGGGPYNKEDMWQQQHVTIPLLKRVPQGFLCMTLSISLPLVYNGLPGGPKCESPLVCIQNQRKTSCSQLILRCSETMSFHFVYSYVESKNNCVNFMMTWRWGRAADNPP